MKFKVVENHQPDYDIEEVKKDYTETDTPVKEIRAKYGISQGQWLTILKHWKREGVTMRGRNYCSRKGSIFTTYYYPHGNTGRYVILRSIGGKSYYFGICNNEEEAKARVKELQANNWNGLLKGE